jgi:acyl-CoA thioesterase-2
MIERVKALVELLRIEPLEKNLFRGLSVDIGSPNLFGGQVLGQALMAAAATVDASRSVHSLHGYFLRPGDKTAPVVYDVERIRDGTSFTTRRVVAIQHGRPIFNCAASFQVREDGVFHQDTMPEVPPPESLASDTEMRRQMIARLPEAQRVNVEAESAIDLRPVHPIDPRDPPTREPRTQSWMRARAALPDDPVLHQAALAYASDFGILPTAMLPHGLSVLDPRMQIASLDHAMWFHADFRIDEWLLYATDSPAAGGARALCRGSVFRADGRLVASVAQEGLMRRHPAG